MSAVFTVGVISGGTSVNAIAAAAKMEMDMRSNQGKELLEVEAKILEIVKAAAAEENTRWRSDKITVDIKLVGDRPGGIQPKDAVIVQTAWGSSVAVGLKPNLRDPQNMDTNTPISLGIPAVGINGRGQDGKQPLTQRVF